MRKIDQRKKTMILLGMIFIISISQFIFFLLIVSFGLTTSSILFPSGFSAIFLGTVVIIVFLKIKRESV